MPGDIEQVTGDLEKGQQTCEAWIWPNRRLNRREHWHHP